MTSSNTSQPKTELLKQELEKGILVYDTLKEFFSHYSDIQFIPTDYEQDITSFYCEGMIDTTQVNDYFQNVIKKINDIHQEDPNDAPPIKKITSIQNLIKKVFSGYLILYKKGETTFYGVDFAKIPQRNVAESTTEVSIKGPKDAFNEDLKVNISLIRKRLKSEHLYNESFTVGTISQTNVSLMYLNNKANNETIEIIRTRLENLYTESIVSSGQLEQWLADKTFSLFPLFDYIMRPDFVVECLMRGRFIILVDGSPSVLIGPINLLELIKSPEDVHFPYYFVLFQRILRIIGINLAILLPGFWIAIVSVNLDQLPFPLLATVVLSREGLPFPTAIEAFFILGLFEILREAGVRMPTPLGQTVSIVGGLIIGDAAIRAGLAAPSLIVIIALTAVATYTLVNQSLTGTVTILRIYALAFSSFLGIYGFFISMFSILIYLCRLQSIQVDYLEPITSLTFKDFLSALLVNPFKRKEFSSTMLQKRRKG